MTMGGAVLTLLCVWSCILQVTPLTEVDVKRATDYFEEQIFQGYDYQYAYFVKFTVEECRDGLQPDDLEAVMNQITATDVFNIVEAREEIYEGARMVAAAPKYRDPNDPSKGSYHSEFRLLHPDNDSPISRLLARNPPAGCVLFFTLNSPCVQYCTNPSGRYNIITKLKKLKRLPNNPQDRAFSFWNVYSSDGNINVWDNWRALNNVMNLYRCRNRDCIKCFDNKGVQNNNCLA